MQKALETAFPGRLKLLYRARYYFISIHFQNEGFGGRGAEEVNPLII